MSHEKGQTPAERSPPRLPTAESTPCARRSLPPPCGCRHSAFLESTPRGISPCGQRSPTSMRSPYWPPLPPSCAARPVRAPSGYGPPTTRAPMCWTTAESPVPADLSTPSRSRRLPPRPESPPPTHPAIAERAPPRSEEHTSELQSLRHLV